MYEEELNVEQLEVALQGDGPCLVLAGAGSGKTRTITYRVAYLLSKGIDSRNILLVTFTNRAAKEMMHRVSSLTEGNISLPWSGTFHHVAYRILRRYAPLLGYKNNFTILDSEDSRDLMKLCIKGDGVDTSQRRFPSAAVLCNILSYARNASTTIHDVLELRHPKWFDLEEHIARIASDYTKRKKEANAMDFDDLLTNLNLLLIKSEKVRAKYAEQFQYILVDEYQDTNSVQASIIKSLASVHKNILVVGDDAQSIYSFRAADIQNILAFEKTYPDAKIFKLETNYRSTPNILTVANGVIAQNKDQYQKELRSVLEAFAKPELHAFSDASEEADFIAGRILELREEGVSMDQMSILFRAAYHSQALEMELMKRNIPYDYRGGTRFFERAHIKDVLAYLRIFTNTNDMIAWSRVLNKQIGIGPASAGKAIIAVRQMKDLDRLEEVESVFSARGKNGWGDLMSVWNEMKKTNRSSAVLIRAVAESKYKEYLETEFTDYKERFQDIEQLALFAEKQLDVTKFLAEASLQESYAAASVNSIDDEEEKVVLSTIHQAKGLEWEAVFVMHVASNYFPNERALREDNGLEEERRLFYVAVTRAKKYLHLSYPLTAGYQSTLLGPSMFLDEIDRDLLLEHHIESSTIFTDPSDEVDDIVYIAEEDTQWRPKPGRFLKSIDEL
ncbi:MAG: ATP-dependent helicase [Candidatus Magasanikbacteria bacterium]